MMTSWSTAHSTSSAGKDLDSGSTSNVQYLYCTVSVSVYRFRVGLQFKQCSQSHAFFTSLPALHRVKGGDVLIGEPVFVIAEADGGCVYSICDAFKTKTLADASLKPSKSGGETFVVELIVEA
jgi:hypothetical protein